MTKKQKKQLRQEKFEAERAKLIESLGENGYYQLFGHCKFIDIDENGFGIWK